MCTPTAAWIRWGSEVNLPRGRTKGHGKSPLTQEWQEIGNYFSCDRQQTFDELNASSHGSQRLATWKAIGENAMQNSTKNKRSEIRKNAWAGKDGRAIRPGAIGKVKHCEGMQSAVCTFRKSGSQSKIKWKSCEDQLTKERMAMQPQYAWLENCRNLTKHAILFIPSQPLSHR